ncbi:MAG TPA: hypothetical protein VGM41_09020 [Chitinophagaceae bacterium]|jgi:hypothetical protein
MIRRFLRLQYHPFFIRLFHWEYWSFNAIYPLILPVWAWLGLRARSFFFFSTANPSIEYGGFMMESKKKIYDLLPPGTYPKTRYFRTGTDPGTVLQQVKTAGFHYPLVGKPDVGGKGKGVKKLADEAELLAYAQWSQLDYLVQEFVPQPKEAGIFYYRYPGDAAGRISGIVRKELLTVKGDGKQTIRQLLELDKRFILQIPVLQIMYGDALNEILPAGMKKELVPYGNHARGAKFLDDSHLADECLTGNIDALCRQVKGFYYGRLDIRYNTWEELRQGKNYSIIELNGAGSEPTHIYDPRHSLFFAWKEIIRHWIILWRISRLNHKKGLPYLTMGEGLQMLKENRVFEQKIDTLYV